MTHLGAGIGRSEINFDVSPTISEAIVINMGMARHDGKVKAP
jgi:hypothetical protein